MKKAVSRSFIPVPLESRTMRRRSGVGLPIIVMLSLSTAVVHAEGHGLAARAGVLGAGLEYTYSPSDVVSFRLGWNGSKIGFDSEQSGINYEVDLVWDSISAALDLHPLKGPWRLSAGVLSNDNRVEAIGQLARSVTIGEETYSRAEVGRLTGRVEFDDLAAFVSMGWDWSRHKRVGLSFDIGVLKQGKPELALQASGPIASHPDFRTNLAIERDELQESLDDWDILPFANFGIVFRF